jgi:hypothetical protein
MAALCRLRIDVVGRDSHDPGEGTQGIRAIGRPRPTGGSGEVHVVICMPVLVGSPGLD